MSDVVRIGIIGCGSVSRVYIPHIQRLNHPRPISEIVLACDADPARAEVLRERDGITAFTTDYREVIDHPDIDLVLILAPMQLHGKITGEALRAGKHVLVEKPLSMDLAEAASLVELAKTSPGYLLCAPHVVLSPTYQAMWRRIHRGDIGTVMSARGFYGWSGPNWGEWYYRPGGGSMFDLGVYNVTSLTGLLGPAKRVTAMSGVAIPEREVNGKTVAVESHDNAHLLLDFGDARYAVVTTGFTIQRYRNHGLELYGTDGTIQMLGEDWAPQGYELWQNEVGAWQVVEDGSHWPWSDGIRHMIESIRSGTPPVITPEHAYHVLEIMTASMRAGDTGQAQQIASTFTPPRFDDAPLLGGAEAHLAHDGGRAG
jgi:predicted dehydrogenase